MDPMPPTRDRAPSHIPGYFDSDDDWSRENPGVLTWLIDNHQEIRAAVEAARN